MKNLNGDIRNSVKSESIFCIITILNNICLLANVYEYLREMGYRFVALKYFRK